MKTALITGATGGIGQALVRQFSMAGYRVIGVDIHQPDLHSPHTAHTDFITVDLYELCRDEAYAKDFFSAVAGKLKEGGLDVLINNAAVQILGSVRELSRSDWRHVMDVNVTAPFILVQGLLEALVAARGAVVNISSIHATLTKPRFTAYATSKAALAGLTRALAVDLGGQVRVNAIAPAAIETPMLKAGFEGKPESYASLKAHHPSQMIGSPDEVARMALLLSSPDSPFLNGAIVSLDGGISARLHDPE